jgi:serine/threonine protein kinase
MQSTTPIESLIEDQARRLRHGEAAPLESYLDQYPQLHEEPEALIALILNEVALREERGEFPRLDEYVERFPALARELGLHFEVKSALGAVAAPSLVTNDVEPGEQRRLGADQAPPSVPGYEIRGLLGRGGMGLVYRAFDKARNTEVALKTVRYDNPSSILRFKQEFRSLLELVHPNLVRLYELISDGLGWFIVMELVDGVDFISYVRRDAGPGPVTDPHQAGVIRTVDHPSLVAEQAAGTRVAVPTAAHPPLTSQGRRRLRDAVLQLAQGVAAVHEAGKLHRDIKPSNVMVTREGRVVLFDFGLVAELGHRGLAQAAGSNTLGTAAYMAPEQAAGQPVGPAGDWYSVGVMLYETLTGRLPYLGSALEVMMDKQRFDPPPPREIVPGLPEDLATLSMDLLRREPTARPQGRDVLRRLGSRMSDDPLAPIPSSGGQPALVGRDWHRSVLDDTFAIVTRGKSAIVRLHGRSGEGKSALVQRFLDELRDADRAVILAGRCYEQESVPYKALDSVIDTLVLYLSGQSTADVRSLLPRDVGPLARVFPVLRRVEAVNEARRGADIPDPQELRRRAFAALRDLLARLGDQRPLVVAIDDVQWGDMDSANLLGEILRLPNPPVLLLLVTYRSEEAEISQFIQSLLALGKASEREVQSVDLAVKPLTPDESRELAFLLLRSEGRTALEKAEEVARESQGNPFFVAELVRHIQAGAGIRPGAATEAADLDDVLWARILRLPDDARRLLEVVAVSGRPLRQTDAFRCMNGAGDGRPALALLRSGRLVRGVAGSDGEEIETYHDRVRETVVARLSPEALRGHHARLASALEASGNSDPEVLGNHFHAAGQSAKAGGYFAQAAAHAAESLAFDRAAKLYKAALELPLGDPTQAQRLRRALGDALANAGRGAEAARAYLAAVKGATVAEALELCRLTAQQFLISGHIDEGLASLRDVLSAVGMRLPATPFGSLLSWKWQCLQIRLRGLGYRRRDPSQIAPADLTRIDICWSASIGLSNVEWIRGTDFQSRCLLLALRAGERSRIAHSLAMYALHCSTAGLRAHARTAQLLEAADKLSREVGEPYAAGMVAMCRGVASFLEGQWSEAREHCDEAEQILRDHCTGVAWERDTCRAFGLWSLSKLGQLAELGRRWPQFLADARERGDLYAVMNLSTYLLSMVRLAADEPDKAREEVGGAMARSSRGGYHVQHNEQAWGTAQIELYTGNGATAHELISGIWPALARSNLLWVEFIRVGMLQLRARCALAKAVNALDPMPLRRAALADANRLEADRTPWSVASARVVRGTLAQAAGDLARASLLLTDAADRFDAAGMAVEAASVRRQLGRLKGGEEGKVLVGQADALMIAEGIRRPDRMAEIYAPGFINLP